MASPNRDQTVTRRSTFCLTDDIQSAYLQADDTERRLFNQAFFETLAIDTEEVNDHTLAAPFAQLAAVNSHFESKPRQPRQAAKRRTPDLVAGGSYLPHLVELGGLEPPTSWVRSRRSPN